MLSRSEINDRLDYDPSTGVFTWKMRPGCDRTTNTWNTRYAGGVAGSVKRTDTSVEYLMICIDNKQYRAHQLAWILIHDSELLPPVIDHFDGDGLNNRISNLRPLSHSLNIRKGKIQKNNTSGMKGVSFRSDTGKWMARCKIGESYKSLGSFDSKDEAFKAYCEKVKDLTGEIHASLIIK